MSDYVHAVRPYTIYSFLCSKFLQFFTEKWVCERLLYIHCQATKIDYKRRVRRVSKVPYHRRSDVRVRYPHDGRHRVDLDSARRSSNTASQKTSLNWVTRVYQHFTTQTLQTAGVDLYCTRRTAARTAVSQSLSVRFTHICQSDAHMSAVAEMPSGAYA